jgi:hypothetical protein
MLKRFVPQKPMPPITERSRYSGMEDDNNHPANGEEPIITTTIIDKPKPMADHGGKDILSSDVEIKGSIKFQKELLIDGKVEGEINSDGVLTNRKSPAARFPRSRPRGARKSCVPASQSRQHLEGADKKGIQGLASGGQSVACKSQS